MLKSVFLLRFLCVKKGKYGRMCWWVTCIWLWLCACVLTGNRPSVPKLPVSRDHLLLQNLLLLQLRFQLQLQLHPISMKSLGTAECESTFDNVSLLGRKCQWLCISQQVWKLKHYVFAKHMISTTFFFSRRESIFNSRNLTSVNFNIKCYNFSHSTSSSEEQIQ